MKVDEKKMSDICRTKGDSQGERNSVLYFYKLRLTFRIINVLSGPGTESPRGGGLGLGVVLDKK